MIFPVGYIKTRDLHGLFYRATVTDIIHPRRMLRKRIERASGAEKYGEKFAYRYNRCYCYKVMGSYKDYYVVENVQSGTRIQVSRHNGGIVGIV